MYNVSVLKHIGCVMMRIKHIQSFWSCIIWILLLLLNEGIKWTLGSSYKCWHHSGWPFIPHDTWWSSLPFSLLTLAWNPLHLRIWATIEILWEMCSTVIWLLVIRPLWNFAHATTAQLWCHATCKILVQSLYLNSKMTFPSNLNCNEKIKCKNKHLAMSEKQATKHLV